VIVARDKATGVILKGEAAIRALAAQTATLVKEERKLELAIRHKD
jgi:hypothetical protein